MKRFEGVRNLLELSLVIFVYSQGRDHRYSRYSKGQAVVRASARDR
jgi:hypothetical protein